MNNSELLERFRELEARLQKVNTELDGLRVAIKGRTFTEKKAETPTKAYEVGEYVRVKPYEDIEGFVGEVAATIKRPYGFSYCVLGKDATALDIGVDMLEEWQPKKGEMCIFWDNNMVCDCIIKIFDSDKLSQYFDSEGDWWDNCIPFLSEQQYKRHIGYEK